MVKGGYKIIDLSGVDFTSGVASTISGIYDSVKNVYCKSTLVSGLKVGDTEYPDFYSIFLPNETNYFTANVIGDTSIAITVTNEDAVTVTIS